MITQCYNSIAEWGYVSFFTPGIDYSIPGAFNGPVCSHQKSAISTIFNIPENSVPHRHPFSRHAGTGNYFDIQKFMPVLKYLFMRLCEAAILG
jgi:hypothetical protein